MDNKLIKQGYKILAGADEAGRGAWAGPLIAAAVIMPKQKIRGVKDSKKLSHLQREKLFHKIIERADAISITSVSQNEIDQLGVHQANLLALSYAITHLDHSPDLVLIDGFKVEHYIETQKVINGDSLSYSIACASIVAKVIRDQFMQMLDRVDARYGFAKHKGYGTKYHQQQLNNCGVSQFHRQSFAPVQQLIYN